MHVLAPTVNSQLATSVRQLRVYLGFYIPACLDLALSFFGSYEAGSVFIGGGVGGERGGWSSVWSSSSPRFDPQSPSGRSVAGVVPAGAARAAVSVSESTLWGAGVFLRLVPKSGGQDVWVWEPKKKKKKKGIHRRAVPQKMWGKRQKMKKKSRRGTLRRVRDGAVWSSLPLCLRRPPPAAGGARSVCFITTLPLFRSFPHICLQEEKAHSDRIVPPHNKK